MKPETADKIILYGSYGLIAAGLMAAVLGCTVATLSLWLSFTLGTFVLLAWCLLLGIWVVWG